MTSSPWGPSRRSLRSTQDVRHVQTAVCRRRPNRLSSRRQEDDISPRGMSLPGDGAPRGAHDIGRFGSADTARGIESGKVPGDDQQGEAVQQHPAKGRAVLRSTSHPARRQALAGPATNYRARRLRRTVLISASAARLLGFELPADSIGIVNGAAASHEPRGLVSIALVTQSCINVSCVMVNVVDGREVSLRTTRRRIQDPERVGEPGEHQEAEDRLRRVHHNERAIDTVEVVLASIDRDAGRVDELHPAEIQFDAVAGVPPFDEDALDSSGAVEMSRARVSRSRTVGPATCGVVGRHWHRRRPPRAVGMTSAIAEDAVSTVFVPSDG